MGAHTLSGVLASAALVVQLLAVVMASSLPWPLGRFAPWATMLGAMGLMALRRALSALGTGGPSPPESWPVVQEGLGLLISALFVVAVVLARGEAGVGVMGRRESTHGSAAEADAVRGDERRLLCYDLHDGLAQTVAAARMHLETFCSLHTPTDDRSERELELCRARLKDAGDEVVRTVSWLCSVSIDDTSISEAVRDHLAEVAECEGWEYELDDRLHPRRPNRAAEMATYRIIQEALNNAAKHAETQRVKVWLYEKDGDLVAAVRDWGRGFDLSASLRESHGLGLRGMLARAQLLGGTCAFNSRIGHGTTVVLWVPNAVKGGDDPS